MLRKKRELILNFKVTESERNEAKKILQEINFRERLFYGEILLQALRIRKKFDSRLK